MIQNRKNQKEAEGYLTVFVALSLAVMLSLFLVLLEGVRAHTLQLESQLVADIAADSVLAEYHREMFEKYGMFWLDTSYGEQNPSIDLVKERVEWYVGRNLDMDDVFLGDYFYRDFLAMELEEITVTGVAVASDGQGRFFRDRAREVVKDEIGISFLEGIVGWLETIETYGLLESTLEAEKEEADHILEEWNGKQVQVGKKWVTIEVKNPTIPMEELKRKGILNQVLDHGENVSAKSVELNQLISHRRYQEGINQGNWRIEGTEGILDRLLWQEYLMRYCGFFGQEREDCLLQYQMEYLIVGKENDTENLRSVVNRILAIREAANSLYLYSDKAKMGIIDAVATVISAAITLPELQPVFKTVIALGWAYAESLYDIKCLLEGEEVPLLKTKKSWHYDLGFILDDINLDWLLDKITGKDEGEEESEDEKEFALAYEDYLRIFLAVSSLEEQTFRMMDIMEMDIRQTPGNEWFRMDGCVDRFAVQICIKSSYGYEMVIDKKKRY